VTASISIKEDAKLATPEQIAANAENAKKGGVRSSEGKALTRLNARKHGIFASALTEYDAEELEGIYDRLADHIKPVGPVEDMLVEKLALTYLRLQRCARAETELYILSRGEYMADEPLNLRAKDTIYGLNQGQAKADHFETIVRLTSRYDTSLTNQMIRLLHETERLQRMRLGEEVLPPVAADVTVHLPEGATLATTPPDGPEVAEPSVGPGEPAPALLADEDSSSPPPATEPVPVDTIK
jgi:hypothetical protein